MYLIAAILLSPILGVFVSSVSRDFFYLFIMDFQSWVHNIPMFLLSDIARSFLGLYVSLPVVIIYGLPVFYLLRRYKQNNVWMFGFFGLLPAVISAFISLFDPDQTLEILSIYSIGTGLLDGSITAIFFWFIAVYIPLRKNEELNSNKRMQPDAVKPRR